MHKTGANGRTAAAFQPAAAGMPPLKQPLLRSEQTGTEPQKSRTLSRESRMLSGLSWRMSAVTAGVTGTTKERFFVSQDMEKPASRTQWSTGLLFESGRKMGLPAADSSDA